MSRNGTAEKVRFLRALSFHIHKKVPPVEALTICIEAEGRGGRHRQWKQAVSVLESDGFVAALLAADMLDPQVAALMNVVEKAHDHRLLSDAINAVATFLDENP